MALALYIERAAKDATWTALVEAFVAVFQQQSSLDLLEAEWDALQQGTNSVTVYYAKFVELCNAVQADLTSAFVVRKFLRHLNPLIYSNLIIHFGGRIEVEDEDLGNIHRVAQQFEAAIAQQSKVVVAKTGVTKTVQADRQQLQYSYCQLKGHNVTTCYKKQHAARQSQADQD